MGQISVSSDSLDCIYDRLVNLEIKISSFLLNPYCNKAHLIHDEILRKEIESIREKIMELMENE